MNYYNEFDPKAAAWLRELIKQGAIPDGHVDERSILDVRPVDLDGYRQVHFFSGIGGWDQALKLVGWPEDRPVWTGSCPCQGFSVAGKGGGFDDERHLWPAFYELISACNPPVVFGEQVASPLTVGPVRSGGKRMSEERLEQLVRSLGEAATEELGRVWLDLVSDDLERAGYTCGAAVFPAASVGAPHGRHRLYWLADAGGAGREGLPRHGDRGNEPRRDDAHPARSVAEAGAVDRVADADGGLPRDRSVQRGGEHGFQPAGGGACGMADTDQGQRGRGAVERLALDHGPARERDQGDGIAQSGRALDGVDAGRGTGAAHVDWRDADWLRCRDGKWRSVEPGTQPLAHGLPARLGRLRGFGNAIVPSQAAAFIQAYLDLTPLSD